MWCLVGSRAAASGVRAGGSIGRRAGNVQSGGMKEVFPPTHSGDVHIHEIHWNVHCATWVAIRQYCRQVLISSCGGRFQLTRELWDHGFVCVLWTTQPPGLRGGERRRVTWRLACGFGVEQIQNAIGGKVFRKRKKKALGKGNRISPERFGPGHVWCPQFLQ